MPKSIDSLRPLLFDPDEENIVGVGQVLPFANPRRQSGNSTGPSSLAEGQLGAQTREASLVRSSGPRSTICPDSAAAQWIETARMRGELDPTYFAAAGTDRAKKLGK